nr:NB-ARC domain-containing protein [Streptomyces olivoverticillatus]
MALPWGKPAKGVKVVEEDRGLSFGLLLRRCRLAAGMTQEELAAASTLSVRAISDLERGRTGRPQRRSVALLAEALSQDEEGVWRLTEAARSARLAPEHGGTPSHSGGGGPGTASDDPYEVRAPAHPGTYGPCDSQGNAACELPPDLADFTARERELHYFDNALAVPGPTSSARRPMLVTGPPGVGKTALAVHAAHRSRARFPDGQVYVELAPAGRPALRPAEVVHRILHSVGAADESLGSLEEASARLRAFLARKRVLVVLDDAVTEGQVRCARPAVGSSAVIATCRRRLSALADADSIEVGVFGPEESLRFLARMLGEERLGAARSDAAWVAEVCGHLPLALRAVGCRLLARPHWTVRTLVEEVLDDPRTRLRELSSGDLTVRAAVAASFALLDEQAQGALPRLAGVLRQGFSSYGAAVVLGCGVARARRIVGDLTDCHLVEVLDGQPSGEPRYRIPPLVRLFALEAVPLPVPALTDVLTGGGQRVV